MSKSSLKDMMLKTPEQARSGGYKIADVTPGILHFGVGNFHRAHQAHYLDLLMELNGDLQWGIIGAGVMPGDGALRERLKLQNYLSTIVEETTTQSRTHIIGSMIDFLPIGDAEAIISTIASPDIKIISLTITEGGYFLDELTGKFNPNHRAIVTDITTPEPPKTIFGLILAGLARRKSRGLGGLTILSCDNLPHNGIVARDAVIGMATQINRELLDWIEVHITFPSSMVDRITPATGERELERIRVEFGIDDVAPVFCEDFKQWVLEDSFAAGRPELEKVGVEFTTDVAAYELMKLRILNGGHAAMAYPAELLGYKYSADAMADRLIVEYLEALYKREIIPSVPPVSNTNLNAYAERVVTRFSNSRIVDTIERLCNDGKNRQPKFIIPTIRDRLVDKLDVTGLALVSALWCRYCQGKREDGSQIVSTDSTWSDLQSVAIASNANPAAWLQQTDIYGDLGENEDFVVAFAHALDLIRTKGVRFTLNDYVNI